MEKGWQVVIKSAPCDCYNMSEKFPKAHDEVTFCESESYNIIKDEDVKWDRVKLLKF